jgi:glycosyltransferase involved in cell wall biosynthesis
MHSCAEYIEGCCTSIAEQDYPQKCWVVIDDNSPDDSYDIVYNLMKDKDEDEDMVTGRIEDLFTILLRHENSQGPAAARNTGIKKMFNSVHFFCPLDADDEYLQGKLSKSIMTMMMDPKKMGLVYSDVIIYDIESDTKIHEFRRPYDREMIERENIISNAPVINRLALQEVGLYDPNLRTCEDWDLWLRITERYMAAHIPEPLQIYRVTGKNATNTVKEEQWKKDWLTVQQKLHERMQ